MTSLLQYQLENEKQRFAQLLKQGRQDTIAMHVLSRMQRDINNLDRKLKHEERPRKENSSYTSGSGFKERAKQAFRRYWPKRNSNHHAISPVPESNTL